MENGKLLKSCLILHEGRGFLLKKLSSPFGTFEIYSQGLDHKLETGNYSSNMKRTDDYLYEISDRVTSISGSTYLIYGAMKSISSHLGPNLILEYFSFLLSLTYNLGMTLLAFVKGKTSCSLPL